MGNRATLSPQPPYPPAHCPTQGGPGIHGHGSNDTAMPPAWHAQGGKARPARVALTLCPFFLCLPGHKTREAPYSTIEPHLQEHCSSSPPLSYLLLLWISTLSQKEVWPSPSTQGGMVPGAPKDTKNQIPSIKWPRRMNTTVPLYLRVSHSQIQPNTEGNLVGCLYR